MVEFQLYEGEPVAVPALRIMTIVSGSLHDPANRTAMAKAYELFEASFGEAANVNSYNFPGHKGKIRWMNPSLAREGREFFERETIGYGQGLRRYGYALEAFEEPALPYFCVEQRSDLFFLEIDLPHDDPQAIAFADEISALLMGIEVVWGAVSLGMFLPPYKSSLGFEMGKSTPRYRTSLEISPSMVVEGVRVEGSNHRWKPGEEPGIGDIGWRTFIGREFWPRVVDGIAALKTEKDVTVEQSSMVLSVTAGKKPIWGDINANEDISTYQAIARHLAPIRYPESAAKAFMFGGGGLDDPRAADKVEAYLDRFYK